MGISGLPYEIVQRVLFYLEFDKVCSIDTYIAKQLYDPKKHNWDYAVDNKNLGIAKFLAENSENLCTTQNKYNAIKNGDLEMIKLLDKESAKGRMIGCWDYYPKSYLSAAASQGYLEIVKYFHRTDLCNGECTPTILSYAVENEHSNVEKWLRENCAICCSSYHEANRISEGNQIAADFLFKTRTHDNFSDALMIACKKNNFEVIKWLCNTEQFEIYDVYDEDNIVLIRAIKKIVSSRCVNLDMVKFLWSKYLELLSDFIIKSTDNNYREEVKEILFDGTRS